MKSISKYLTLLIILATLLSACNQNVPVTPIAESTATAALPTPNVNINSGPDVEEALLVSGTLKLEDYQAMYEHLSRLTKDAVTLEALKVATMMLPKVDHARVEFQILSTMINITTAQ